MTKRRHMEDVSGFLNLLIYIIRKMSLHWINHFLNKVRPKQHIKPHCLRMCLFKPRPLFIFGHLYLLEVQHFQYPCLFSAPNVQVRAQI